MARARLALHGACAVVLLIAATAGAALAASTLDTVRERGRIVFAYRDGALPFSFKSRDGHVRGYTVELCERIADAIRRELKRPDLKVEWVPVDAGSRLDAVTSGRVDAECGTTTITLGRMERVDFSVPIFVDGGALVVKSQSPVQRLADLKGRRVAVIKGTTTERALQSALQVGDVQSTLVPIARPEDGAKALREGRADAWAGDRLVLTQVLLRDPEGEFTVLADDFSFEPYGIVVRRNDADFRLLVNRALVSAFKRGEIDSIFQRWLAPLGKPSALINAMFYLNALPD